MNSDVATGRWMKGVEMLMSDLVLERDQPPSRGVLAASFGVPLTIETCVPFCSLRLAVDDDELAFLQALGDDGGDPIVALELTT